MPWIYCKDCKKNTDACLYNSNSFNNIKHYYCPLCNLKWVQKDDKLIGFGEVYHIRIISYMDTQTGHLKKNNIYQIDTNNENIETQKERENIDLDKLKEENKQLKIENQKLKHFINYKTEILVKK